MLPFFSVYSGNCISNLVQLAAGTTATFEVTADVTYAIAVDGSGGTTGKASMQLTLTPHPANDDFAQRIVLQGATPVLSGSNIGASPETGEPLIDSSSQGHSVWWTWTAPSSGSVTIGDTGSFLIGVFVGSSVSDLVPVSTDFGRVSFYAFADTTYQIAVADRNGDEGMFDLAFTGLLPAPETTDFSARLADGRFRLQIIGAVGQSFAVQASTNLIDWETVTIDTLIDDTTDFLDVDAPQFTHRFYRVLPLDALEWTQ